MSKQKEIYSINETAHKMTVRVFNSYLSPHNHWYAYIMATSDFSQIIKKIKYGSNNPIKMTPVIHFTGA